MSARWDLQTRGHEAVSWQTHCDCHLAAEPMPLSSVHPSHPHPLFLQTLVEVDKVGLAREILDKAVKRGVRFLLPVDVMAGDTLEEGAKTEVVRVYPGCCGPDSPCVRPGLCGGDVGPETAELYARSLQTW